MLKASMYPYVRQTPLLGSREAVLKETLQAFPCGNVCFWGPTSAWFFGIKSLQKFVSDAHPFDTLP